MQEKSARFQCGKQYVRERFFAKGLLLGGRPFAGKYDVEISSDSEPNGRV